MSSGDLIVVLVVAAALPARVALTTAAILNFVGAFISLKVAATVATRAGSLLARDNRGGVGFGVRQMADGLGRP